MTKHPISRAFREWTRGTTFTLTMGKGQVATLVALHASASRRQTLGREHKLLRAFVNSAYGLVERGLVDYVAPPSLEEDRALGETWKLTNAGAHVIGLLKLSGVYDELVAEFIQSDRARIQLSRRLRLRLA